MSSRAFNLLLFGSIVLSGVVKCGGSGSSGRGDDTPLATGGGAPVAGSAGVGAAGAATVSCQSPTVGDYQAHWMPPKAHPGACTTEQIADEYALCVNPKTYDEQACQASHAGAAAVICLDCLYSTLVADESQAILLLDGRNALANVGGCIALLDGDSSDTGCGALTQAADICAIAVCDAACPEGVASAEFNGCWARAITGACVKYSSVAQCREQPRYSRCVHQAFQDYFVTVADLFCGAGPPDTQSPGAPGAAGAAP